MGDLLYIVSEKELYQMIGGGTNVIAAGAISSIDFNERRRVYRKHQQLHTGTMYYAETDNMKSSENKLRRFLRDDKLFHYVTPIASRGRVYVIIKGGVSSVGCTVHIGNHCLFGSLSLVQFAAEGSV